MRRRGKVTEIRPQTSSKRCNEREKRGDEEERELAYVWLLGSNHPGAKELLRCIIGKN